MPQPTRIVFFGTAPLAGTSLEALAAHPGFELLAAVTQPDKPKGRDLALLPTPVKAAALKLGLPVLQPPRAREPAFLDQIRALQPDLIVVVAYGQILTQALLDIPRHGCLNVHTSILPRHRGAAPIQWAILSGDQETGVTLMKMDAGMDTGPILAIEATPIGPEENSQMLHDRLASIGAALLVRSIPAYIEGALEPKPQAGQATYTRKIEKQDGLIDWSQPAREIALKVRAFDPWPGAFTFQAGTEPKRLIKLWQAVAEETSGPPGSLLESNQSNREGLLIGCGVGALRVKTLQPEGRRRMSAAEFAAGHPLVKGQELFR